MISIETRNQKNSRKLRIVDVAFPAFQDLPEKRFHWSPTEKSDELEFYNHIFDETIFYQKKLASIPSGTHQRDRGNDYCEFSVANKENEIYSEFLPQLPISYDKILQKGKVIVWDLVQNTLGNFESEIRFYGFLQTMKVSENSNTINFTALSDMSRKNFQVGNVILTKERCGTEFNYNGLNNAEFHICGWQTNQGGNATYCSKYLFGVDGCIAHNNAHRFFAVPSLANAQVKVVTNQEVGFEYQIGDPNLLTPIV